MSQLIERMQAANLLDEGLIEKSHNISRKFYSADIHPQGKLNLLNAKPNLTTPSIQLSNDQKISILQRWLANIQGNLKEPGELKTAECPVEPPVTPPHRPNEDKIRILERWLMNIRKNTKGQW